MLFIRLASIALGILAFIGPSAAEKRVALVIGNSAYAYVKPLANPRNDATDIAKALQGLGFEVIAGYDLDKASMDKKLLEFGAAIADAGVGVFFYAGHGMQANGNNYLLPIDTRIVSENTLDTEMVRLDNVQSAMGSERNKTNIIFLDACRDNPLQGKLKSLATRSMGEEVRGLAPVEAAVGTLISFSTQPGAVARDGRGRNSPFTEALVRHIGLRGEDLFSIMIRVRNDVLDATNDAQVPWEQNSLRAKFYFLPEGYSVASVTESAVPLNPPPAVQGGPTAALRGETTTVASADSDATFSSSEPPPSMPSTSSTQAAAAPAAETGGAAEPQVAKRAAQPGEAAEAWQAAKDTTNPAVLEAFLLRFGDTFFGDLARIKLEELRGKQVAMGIGIGAELPKNSGTRDSGSKDTSGDRGGSTGRTEAKPKPFRPATDLKHVRLEKVALSERCGKADASCRFETMLVNTGDEPVIGTFALEEVLKAGGETLEDAIIDAEPSQPWQCEREPPFVCVLPVPLAAGAHVPLKISFAPGATGQETELDNCAVLLKVSQGGASGEGDRLASSERCAQMPLQSDKKVRKQEAEKACPSGTYRTHGECREEKTTRKEKAEPKKETKSYNKKQYAPKENNDAQNAANTLLRAYLQYKYNKQYQKQYKQQNQQQYQQQYQYKKSPY